MKLPWESWLHDNQHYDYSKTRDGDAERGWVDGHVPSQCKRCQCEAWWRKYRDGRTGEDLRPVAKSR